MTEDSVFYTDKATYKKVLAAVNKEEYDKKKHVPLWERITLHME